MAIKNLPAIDGSTVAVGSVQVAVAALTSATEVLDARGRRVAILGPGKRGVFLALDTSDNWAFGEHFLSNQNSAAQSINATTAYVAGSSLAVPSSKLRVGTRLRWRFGITKTAAGSTVGCAFLVKFGTAGTGADTTQLTFTLGTPTAAADTALVEIECVVRSIGAAGVVVGVLEMAHNLAATGFSTLPTEALVVTSAGFDTTVADLIAGISITTTAASVWSVEMVSAEAINV